MIIKLFSKTKKSLSVAKTRRQSSEDYEEKINNPKDADLMVGAGKVGLAGAGVLGTGAVIEGGRSLYHLGKSGQSVKKVVKNIADNPELQRKLENVGKKALAAMEGEGGLSSSIVDSIKAGGKSFIKDSTEIAKNLKSSPIGKAKLVGRIWKATGNESIPRFALLNAEYLSKTGLEKGLGKETAEKLSELPKLVGHLGKTGLHRRNMKYLGKGGAALASLGGILYVNGRALQDPRTGIRKDRKK